MMLMRALTALVVAFSTGSAMAEWKTFDTPDSAIGGTRTILAGRTDRDGEIQVLCNGESRAFNFIAPAWMTSTWSDGQPQQLELANDAGTVVVGEGMTFRAANDSVAGVAFNEPSQIVDLIGVLRDARVSSWFTMTDRLGTSSTYYADTVGIAAAAEAFLDRCGLTRTAENAAPAQGGTWALELGLGSKAVTIAGTAADGTRVVTTCRKGDVTLSVASRDCLDAPPNGTEDLQLELLVDSRSALRGDAVVARLDPGMVSYIYADTAGLFEPLKSIATGSKVEIVVSDGPESRASWVLSSAGAAEAVPDFLELCSQRY